MFRVTVSRFKGVSQVGIQLMNIDEEDEDDDLETPNALYCGIKQMKPMALDNLTEPEMISDDTHEEIVQSPSPLFLKRNLRKIRSMDPQREKKFCAQAGSISISTKSIPVS